MELHEFLDQWRVGRGWTIQRFADEVEVSQSLVSKWLHRDRRRRANPGRENLNKIAEIVGVPTRELRAMVVDPDDADKPLATRAASVDPDLAVVNAAWPGLDEGLRRAIKVLAGAAPLNHHKKWFGLGLTPELSGFAAAHPS